MCVKKRCLCVCVCVGLSVSLPTCECVCGCVGQTEGKCVSGKINSTPRKYIKVIELFLIFNCLIRRLEIRVVRISLL